MTAKSTSNQSILSGVAIFAIVISVSSAAQADTSLLGEIDFPNSGSTDAQKDFINGVLYLHNFEYDEAAEAFKSAQSIDPGFAMAYWGEAMTYNHPLWRQQARDTARNSLRELAKTPEVRAKKASTQREKDYLHAIEILYGTVPESERLSKEARDVLYSEAMRRLHEQYPDDHEAATFYALSILGTASESRNVATYMKAAAIAMKVWDRNRNHPGAAHYLIHSFDDPDHAPLGLPMARAYSKIAPSAAHAQHMTSHIFVALGMWDDTVAANEVALKTERLAAEELPQASFTAGHYAYWLLYGYLQQGRYIDAQKLMEAATEEMRDNPNVAQRRYFLAMRARYIIDTQDWDAVSLYASDETEDNPVYRFTDAIAAVRRGDLDLARTQLTAMKPVSDRYETAGTPEVVEVMKHEVEGLLMIAQGDTQAGIALLEEAIALENDLPLMFGPPNVVQPSVELLALELLAQNRFEEAAVRFEQQLSRTPRRATTLQGLARAQEGAGFKKAAARTYEQLAQVWENADVNVGGYGAVAQEISDSL